MKISILSWYQRILWSSYARLAAAIPLGGTDILAFDLGYDSYTCNQESIKYLEEISEYYKIPVEPFIELIEGHAE